MFLKWIKQYRKKLTSSKEKTQINTSKNNKIGDGSSLNQISISDRSLGNNINAGGVGNNYYNINNSGRDVIINGFQEEKEKIEENSEQSSTYIFEKDLKIIDNLHEHQ